jgi:GT2 family glycosyltransferase
MALRKGVLRKVGLFDEALDVGTPTRGGGDTEMFSRILSKGYRIVYDPHALNWHRHRLRWRELRSQLYGYELAGSAFWMRILLLEGNFGAIEEGLQWLRRELRGLAKALRRRPGSAPLDIVLARFCGAAIGAMGLFVFKMAFAKKEESVVEKYEPLVSVIIPTHNRVDTLRGDP